MGFAKVVVTRAGRSQEWSQGEFRLYSQPIKSPVYIICTNEPRYFEVPRAMGKELKIAGFRNNRGSVKKIRNNESFFE